MESNENNAQNQQQNNPAPEKPSGTKTWVKLLAVFYLIAVVSSFLIIGKTAPGKGPSLKPGEISGFGKIVSAKSDAVAVIPIYGTIYQSNSASIFEKGSQYIAKKIKLMAEKKEVKAIVLDINSPGGTVGAVQEIHSVISRMKAETKKPFVAMFGDMSASGGYYIASACDKIVSHPGALTGSIGVMFSLANFEGLFKKIGVKSEAVKSGKFKDMGSPMREMSEEERKILKGIIDDTYSQFVDAVSAGRNLPRDEVVKLADGRIFTGRQAFDLKLIDITGSLQDAVDLAGVLAGIGKNPRIIKHTDAFEDFFSVLEYKTGLVKIKDFFNQSPRLEYRWDMGD